MYKKIEEQRFEFLLLINGHIVCQRYFSIRGYNEDSINSMELKYAADDAVDLIETDLLAKTEDYLWKFHNPYKTQTQEEVEETKKVLGKKEDIFEFQIRVDKRPVIQKIFSGNLYPPKVRYQVNIKELIPEIISTIRVALSHKKYDLVESSEVV